MNEPQADLSDAAAELRAVASKPVDHDKLIRDIRESIANPPDLSGLRAQLGLTDRPPRRRPA